MKRYTNSNNHPLFMYIVHWYVNY